MVSVVIPAHNEEQVIGRCLATLLDGTLSGEFEVIVATNGCTDRTAEVAGSFEGVQVVDCPVANKAAALNVGDAAAHRFPRVYLDADIEVDADSVRTLARALSDGSCEVAAPKMVLDLTGRSWWIRAYYDVWTSLPYIRDDHVGSGLYALTEVARGRFDQFPAEMIDDLFVYSLADEGERRCVDDATFTVNPPYTLRSLVRVRSRIFTDNRRASATIDPRADRVNSSRPSALLDVAVSERKPHKVAVYLGVNALAKLRALWRVKVSGDRGWDRDDSARARAASTAEG